MELPGYTANVVDGKVETDATPTKKEKKTSGGELGKDAFLQLLVTQLEYQDPMNPTDNTQMVSQLAQFSALEEMQNVSSAIANSQALSLVGRNVIMEVGKSTGSENTTTVAGYVEYVKMIDGKAMLSINDKLYDYADFDMVIDDKYLESILGSEGNKDETAGDETEGGDVDGETSDAEQKSE